MALDMFINMGANIKGESRDKVQGPKGDIDILSWTWGMSHPAPPTPAVAAAQARPTSRSVVHQIRRQRIERTDERTGQRFAHRRSEVDGT